MPLPFKGARRHFAQKSVCRQKGISSRQYVLKKSSSIFEERTPLTLKSNTLLKTQPRIYGDLFSTNFNLP